MSTVITALIVAAVVVLVLVRRFSAQRVNEKRFLVVPLVLLVLGLRNGNLIAGHHTGLAVGMLSADLVVAVAMGLAIGATMRVWRDGAGELWSKGTKATAGVFLGSVAVRAGLYGLGAALGVSAGTSIMLVFVAVWLVAQYVAIMWRSNRIAPARRATFVA